MKKQKKIQNLIMKPQSFDQDMSKMDVKIQKDHLKDLQNILQCQNIDQDSKQFKKRKQYCKWEDEDKKIYWFGLMAMVEQNPYVKLSWDNWKIDRCFKKMQILFKGTKTNTQIKSLDQRMKKHYKGQKDIDLVDAISNALSQLSLTESQYKKLNEFKSGHMKNKNAYKLEQIIDNLNNQIKQDQKDLLKLKQIASLICKQIKWQ